MPKHICFFTGKRGGFNHFIPLFKAIEKDPELNYSVLAADMHTAAQFGDTLKEVNANAKNVHTVETLMGSDSKISRIKSLGVGILGYADLLARIAPDYMCVLGDRMEILGPVLVAQQLNIPVLHLCGGDLTQGGVDEPVRHAVSKLASLHFPSNKESATRIERMGENGWRIHDIGLPALDLIRQNQFASEALVRERFGLKEGKPVIILLQHSVTWQVEEAEAQIEATLNALNGIDCQVVAVYPCSDPGYTKIIQRLDTFNESNPWFSVYPNIEHQYFWGLMNIASAMIGNSSSGLLESASFNLPVLNIGIRQDGRLRADNVVDVPHDMQSIAQALDKVLNDTTFHNLVANSNSPYGDGRASAKFIKAIKNTRSTDELLKKRMTY